LLCNRGSVMWFYTGAVRPPFAEVPSLGEESVWDYPRPPKLVPDRREVVVTFGEHIIARSSKTIRVLETAGPPTFYVPGTDIKFDELAPVAERSWCEWKGSARYFSLANCAAQSDPVAWTYPQLNPNFAALDNHFGFYPGRLECTVDGERVRAQPGEFYAGWVTDEIVGPMKGEPGTECW